MWLKWKKRLIARSATILYVKCPQIWLIETFCQKCQQSRKIITKCQDILEIPIVLRLNIIFDYKQVHRLFYLFFRWVSGEILKLILLLSVQILLHRIYNNSNIRVWDILYLSTYLYKFIYKYYIGRCSVQHIVIMFLFLRIRDKKIEKYNNVIGIY